LSDAELQTNSGKQVTSFVETPSGEEAIALCKSDTAIDIVFTDIKARPAVGM